MSVTIALAGNPNCGKTTMFNALTGANQYVGNWPGVTVEKKEGKLKNQKDVTVTDLPGIYSLSPYTLEEVVSRDYLLKEKPDVIILDPPRDGVHPKALPKILAYGVDQIVYISCKVTSLVRDLPAFYEAGYEMTHACAVDQFCQGVHVETVCLLSNRNRMTR